MGPKCNYATDESRTQHAQREEHSSQGPRMYHVAVQLIIVLANLSQKQAGRQAAVEEGKEDRN